MEQHKIQARLIELGVKIRPSAILTGVRNGVATLACAYTGRTEEIAAPAVVPVTARLPRHELAQSLRARQSEWEAAGLDSVTVIGDALAPGTIAAAVWSGRRYAEELGTNPDPAGIPFRREVAELLPFDLSSILTR